MNARCHFAAIVRNAVMGALLVVFACAAIGLVGCTNSTPTNSVADFEIKGAWMSGEGSQTLAISADEVTFYNDGILGDTYRSTYVDGVLTLYEEDGSVYQVRTITPLAGDRFYSEITQGKDQGVKDIYTAYFQMR